MFATQEAFDELAIHLTPSNEDMIEKAHILLLDVQNVIPDAELAYVIEMDEETYQKHLDKVYVRFSRNGLFFQISKWYFRGSKAQYHISLDIPEILSYHYSLESQVTQDMDKPHKMWNLNRRSVEAWVEYWTLYYKKIKALIQEIIERETEFRNYLATLPDVQWKSANSGRIERNGLIYTFTINKTSIYQDISLLYSIHDIHDFVLLADNKYQPSEK